MKLKSKFVSQARTSSEDIIKRYKNEVLSKRCGCGDKAWDRWLDYVCKNSTGKKAIRLAGYLTGNGYFK